MIMTVFRLIEKMIKVDSNNDDNNDDLRDNLDMFIDND